MNLNAMTSLLVDAFQDDPMFVRLFIGPHRQRQMRVFIRFLIKRNQLLKGTIYTDEKTYVALLDVQAPVPFINRLLLGLHMLSLVGYIPLKSLRLLNRYQAVAYGAISHPKHYYLTLLGVCPKHQGKGIGKSTLRHIHKDIPKGTVLYLDTENQKNVAYYESFGYRLIKASAVESMTIYSMVIHV